ncbi:lipopolysaccharide biosynthesis protein [Salimicrobium humidisoli]|uniref:Flippase n=1 Tax=Salimicrobium humidisoli TaxID=2029857 RepID=A0ABX4HT96_9BACI|nr:lipopolysaccharide biosynthesis protein [Salimicrobium humidisoli]PBB06462.1 flippase [Salimicrobium humidisoli]
MIKKSQLKSKTLHGLLWSFIELLSRQGIQLIIQIILARLLAPEHFGVIGMVTIFIAVSTAFVQSGLDQALIREKAPGDKDYSTVFYFNLAVSILVYAISFYFAPLIAQFYDESKLVGILRVIMLVVVINAVSSIQRVFLIRKVDFKTQTKISLISGLSAGAFAISFALMGLGVWSLVIQQIVMKFTEMILLLYNNRWAPSFIFDFYLFKKYFNFGYKLLLSSIIDIIYKNIYFVIIGKVYTLNQLGYYTNASKIRDVASLAVTQSIQKVTYPVLSKMNDDQSLLTKNYRLLIRLTAYVYFPFMLGLVCIAPSFIPLLLGEKWVPAINYFQLLCIASLLYPINAINLNILKVKNRSDLFLLIEIIKKIFLSILIIVAVILELGVSGLIYSAIISSIFNLFINAHYTGKEINYNISKQIKDMTPSLLLAIVMSSLIFLNFEYLKTPLFVKIMLEITFGIITYISLSLIFKIEELRLIFTLMRKSSKND